MAKKIICAVLALALCLGIITGCKKPDDPNTPTSSITDFKYSAARSFVEGRAAVADDDNMWGFIDSEGNVKGSLEHYGVKDYSEGFAIVQKKVGSNIYYGMVDLNGSFVSFKDENDSELKGVAGAENYPFTEANSFSNGYASVKYNNSWKVIDNTGKVILSSIEYEDTIYTIEGLQVFEKFGDKVVAKAKINMVISSKPVGAFGYIDPEGNIIIPFKYESFTTASGDYITAQRKIDDSNRVLASTSMYYVIINIGSITDGFVAEELVASEKYSKIEPLKDGYFFAIKNKRYTLLDSNNDMEKLFTLASFNDANNTDGSYMGVRYYDTKGVTENAKDENGEELLNPETNEPYEIKTILRWAVLDINAYADENPSKPADFTGLTAEDYKFYSIGNFNNGKAIAAISYYRLQESVKLDSNGFAVVEEVPAGTEGTFEGTGDNAGKWFRYVYEYTPQEVVKYGMIDSTGAFVIEAKYDSFSSFTGDFAVVTLNKKYGIVNMTGRETLALEHDEIKAFTDSYAITKKGGKYGITSLTTNGKELTAYIYDDIGSSVSEGLIPAMRNNKWGFVRVSL